MTYRLNNQLLTSNRIIATFEKNLVDSEGGKARRWLGTFKRTLKTMFFADLDPKATDQQVLDALASDVRFTTGYPKLKEVLRTIFALKNDGDEAKALVKLKAIGGADWNTDTANDEFDELNTKYGYFDNATDSLRNLFAELAVTCRTIIVLFEKNNTPADTMAYNYAYKLMALYVDPDKLPTFDAISIDIDKLVKNIDSDKGHPFHEALLVKLAPLPHASELTDKVGWREFVKDNGIKAFSFLTMAAKIEGKIAEQPGGPRLLRAPNKLREAKAMAMLCHYDRAGEDCAFAKICYAYNVDECRFDQCLDYMSTGWPKKTADSMPNMVTRGTGEAEGLYWLKLPTEDKRALILGDISHCCQSIGGDAEQCIKDAVSLSDNGLYVLVKQRKIGHFELIVDGAINDKDFKIIGQFYAWKSLSGNVCLDSIECLIGEVTDAAMGDSITQFANALLDKHLDVHYVTVGRGGKTPKGLFKKAIIPEQMRQGYFYGDAEKQYWIARRVPELTEVDEQLKGYGEPFHACMMYLSEHLPPTPDMASEIGALLDKHPALSTQLTPQTLMRLMKFSHPLALSDMEPVDFITLQALSPEEAVAYPPISLGRLIWKMQPVPALPGIRLQLDGITDMTTSAADLGAVLQYLTPEQCKSVCEDMKASLPAIITSVHDFRDVLKYLTPAHCKSVCESMEGLLTKIFNSAPNFCNLLRSLTSEQCKSVCESMEGLLPKIFNSVDCCIAELERFEGMGQHRTIVFEFMNGLLPKIIKSGVEFGEVRDYLTSEQCTSLYYSMKGVLREIIKSADDFLDVHNGLQPAQGSELFKSIEDLLPKIIRSGSNFCTVLLCIEPAQRTSVFESMKGLLPDRITSAGDFRAAVQYLTSEQRQILHDSIGTHWLNIVTEVAPSFSAVKRFVDIDTACSATLLKLAQYTDNESLRPENKVMTNSAIQALTKARDSLRANHLAFIQNRVTNDNMTAREETCCNDIATILKTHIFPIRQESNLAPVLQVMLSELVETILPLAELSASISEITNRLCTVDPVVPATTAKFKVLIEKIRAKEGVRSLATIIKRR